MDHEAVNVGGRNDRAGDPEGQSRGGANIEIKVGDSSIQMSKVQGGENIIPLFEGIEGEPRPQNKSQEGKHAVMIGVGMAMVALGAGWPILDHHVCLSIGMEHESINGHFGEPLEGDSAMISIVDSANVAPQPASEGEVGGFKLDMVGNVLGRELVVKYYQRYS